MSINLNFHICLNTAKEWKNSNNEVGKPKQHEPKQQKKKKKKSSLLRSNPYLSLFQNNNIPKPQRYQNIAMAKSIKIQKNPKIFENKNKSPRSGEVVWRRTEVQRDSAAANGGPVRQCGSKCQSGEDGLEMKSDMRFQGNMK